MEEFEGCKWHISDKEEEGKKYDNGKLRWDLLPTNVIKEVIKVLMHGARKYGDFNWDKTVNEPNGTARYYAAAMRHIRNGGKVKRMIKTQNSTILHMQFVVYYF